MAIPLPSRWYRVTRSSRAGRENWCHEGVTLTYGGIVGMGGLGHIALKLAHAMGAEVVQFTTTPAKATEARRLGADDVVLSHDEQRMTAHDVNTSLDRLARNDVRYRFVLDMVG